MCKGILLWLDDIRDPNDKNVNWLEYSPISKIEKTIWVKNFSEFKLYIETNGLPEAICFDHDLGDDTPSGYDCSKWLVDYCIDNNLKLPKWNCQSANPVGKKNIDSLLINYLKFSNK